jgi:hypothetical protein
MKTSDSARNYLAGIEYRLQRAKYAFRGGTFSHSREQQIIWSYVNELTPPALPKVAVDIGAGNGMRWSNTYSLFLAGWQGLGIEADVRKFRQLERAYRDLPDVKACNSKAGPENVVSILQSFGIPKDFAVLSLDIDGNDYWVLRKILSHFRPALIVTEINEKIPPPLRFTVKFDPSFQLRHHFYGFSIAVLEDLCDEYGYGLLSLEYNNAFITPREVGRGRFLTAEDAYRTGYRDRSERKQRFATNLDVEQVLTMSASEAIRFLEEFYRREDGKYYLASDRESFAESIHAAELQAR